MHLVIGRIVRTVIEAVEKSDMDKRIKRRGPLNALI